MMVAGAIGLQAMSTTMAPSVETIQRDRADTHGVIVNRVLNLAAIARGKTADARFEAIPPEWRTFAYLPFQLRFRFPRLAGWAVALWLALLIALPLEVRFALRAAVARE